MTVASTCPWPYFCGARTATLGEAEVCPEGYYCEDTTAATVADAMVACEAGFWCPEGSKSKEPVEGTGMIWSA